MNLPVYHHFADLRMTVATTLQLQHDYRVGLLTRDEFIDLSNETYEMPEWEAVLFGHLAGTVYTTGEQA